MLNIMANAFSNNSLEYPVCIIKHMSYIISAIYWNRILDILSLIIFNLKTASVQLGLRAFDWQYLWTKCIKWMHVSQTYDVVYINADDK